MKKSLLFLLKFIGLVVLFYIPFSVGSALLGPKLPPLPDVNPTTMLLAVLLVAVVDTLVITLIILRSRWSGWRLMLGLAVSYYGVQTFMAQIESAWFGAPLGITPAMLPGLFTMSLPVVLLFIPLAVMILGRGRPFNAVPEPTGRLKMPALEWVWRLAVIAVIYMVLYFSFGYVVAWSNPNLVAMYGGGTNQQIFSFARLLPLQFGRGVLWALFALPIIAMDRGGRLATALVAGILLALPMNIAHVIPNPIMPDASVRMSHFIETATSNFIFGVVLTLILWRGRSKPAE